MRRLTSLFRFGLLFLMLLSSVLLVSGCAVMRVVDSQVLAMANLPPGFKLQGASYRFERLPLQNDNPEAALAEQLAEQALSAVGMVRDDQLARLSVLLGYQSVSYVSDAYRHGISMPYAIPSRARSFSWGAGFGMGMGTNMPPPVQYRRQVSLIMRDLPSSQVVYETHAVHDGLWSDSTTIFATLFKAGLSNFPNPPAGVQRVTIEIPR
jgi:hypothetical protein